MNEYQACPFLIGRNYDCDYKVIVAPDFVFQNKISNVLLEATGDEGLTTEGWAVYRQVILGDIQDFTIIFRIKNATGKDVYLENNEILTDSVGRAIEIIEGIIILGKISKNDFIITSNNFDDLHHAMMNYYNDFWQGETKSKVNDNFFINKNNSESLILKQLEPFIRHQKNIFVSEEKITNTVFQSRKIIIFVIMVIFLASGFLFSRYLKEKNIKYYLMTITVTKTIIRQQNPLEKSNPNNPKKDECDNYELRKDKKLLVEDFDEINKNFYNVFLAENIGSNSCPKHRRWYIFKDDVKIIKLNHF